MTPAAIDRLRRIAARLLELGDVDGEWFAASLQEYEAGARHGLTLGDAFGFRLRPGESAWYETEARSARDELLRAIARRYFGGMSTRAAADALASKISRYESGSWRGDRIFKLQPTLTGLHAELFKLLKIGQPLSASTIRRALAHETTLFVSHAVRDDAAATNEARHGSNEFEAESDSRSRRNPATAAER